MVATKSPGLPCAIDAAVTSFLADTPKLTLIERIRATPLSLPSHIAEK